MFFEPLEQFEIVFHNASCFIDFLIHDNNFITSLILSFGLFNDSFFYLFGISDWSISIFRVILFYFILFYLVYGSDKGAFIWPQKWQVFSELIYTFLAGMFKEQVGYRGQKYFPFLATIFLFVLFLNLFGMIPYEGAITSQLVFNLSMSFFYFGLFNYYWLFSSRY